MSDDEHELIQGAIEGAICERVKSINRASDGSSLLRGIHADGVESTS